MPQQPTDAQQRAALGLPPLFVPFSEAESGTVTLPGLNGTTPGPIATTSSASSGSLEVQVFAAMKTQEYGSEAHFYSIVAQPEYAKYSFEVQGLHPIPQPSYLVCSYRNYVMRLTGVARSSHKCPLYHQCQYQDNHNSAVRHPPYTHDLILHSRGPYTAALLPSVPLTSTDSLQSVNSMPPYDQHSFEVRHPRDPFVTSADICVLYRSFGWHL